MISPTLPHQARKLLLLPNQTPAARAFLLNPPTSLRRPQFVVPLHSEFNHPTFRLQLVVDATQWRFGFGRSRNFAPGAENVGDIIVFSSRQHRTCSVYDRNPGSPRSIGSSQMNYTGTRVLSAPLDTPQLMLRTNTYPQPNDSPLRLRLGLRFRLYIHRQHPIGL